MKGSWSAAIDIRCEADLHRPPAAVSVGEDGHSHAKQTATRLKGIYVNREEDIDLQALLPLDMPLDVSSQHDIL